MLKNNITKILSLIENFEKKPCNTLCPNVYYLTEDDILCTERNDGESRFPYTEKGTVLWAYSNGFMNANEHNLKLFHSARAYEEPCIDFFAGIKNGNGTFFPVSITGASKQLFEPDHTQRYVVFRRECAHYITKTPDAVFALTAFVSSKKNIHFSLNAINTSEKNIEFYLSSYIEPLMTYTNEPGYWDKMSVTGKYLGEGKYIFNKNAWVSRNIATLNELVSGKKADNEQHTVSRSVFTGGYGHNLFNALSLKSGKFEKEIHAVTRIDFPVFADIYTFKLNPEESTRIDYEFSYSINPDDSDNHVFGSTEPEVADKELENKQNQYKNELNGLSIKFGKLKNSALDENLLNKFLKTVQYSVNFCADNEEYGGRYLGIRDVFQQMEISLIWNPEHVREKIVRWFGYFTDTGRTPRSIAIELAKDMKPLVICEEYIDQGLWVIACVYIYLCYTSDYSVLNETCGFYHIRDDESGWDKTEEKSSVLDHMIRIMDYFIKNLDTEYGTNCLRALMGDWNDSINGLGTTYDKGKRFGSGVSVMASLQLYENFEQMSEILSHIGGYDKHIKKYAFYKEKLKDGLIKYAVDQNGLEKQIIHGWGDKMSYKVGSFCDEDNNRRYSLISNAFWILSGLIKESPELKSSIMSAYSHLDSKYGFITFNPAFTKDMTGVGRMRFILPGNAENACAYIHASMFANMSLFDIGESKLAWEQLYKSIPITHRYINTSPYVMSNQYCDNKEYNSDGEAISDWTTGSNPTLLKSIIKYGFGIKPNLNKLIIAPAKTMPADNAQISLKLNGYNINLIYKNSNNKQRTFRVNNMSMSSKHDLLSDTCFIEIPKEDLCDNLTIFVND